MNFLNDWIEWTPELLRGLLVSLELTAASLAIGLPLGMAFGLLTSARRRLTRYTVLGLVELGRGAPTLIVLYLVYFGLPRVELTLSVFLSATVALSFTSAAYSSEIFRAGLLAVPRGQLEAAQAIGLPRFKQLRLVVLPQAVRVVMAPIVGLSILVFQTTSLAYAISMPELMSRSYNIGSITFKYMSVLTLAGLIYACFAIPAAQLATRLDTKRKEVA